ncbi:uncharacterized protein [Eurosta solidaginis]|uniref:uncharacterized protein isoform X2 n=1 Tax=Eurosta solidaginis TaxID=178769 RepID=UPI0035314B36
MFNRKSLLFLAANLLWISVSCDPNFVQNDIEHEFDNELVKYPAGAQKSLDFLTSARLRKKLEKILEEMPTGWPQHNIPPLAPYKRENITVNYEHDYLTFHSHLEQLQISNLNEMVINEVKNQFIHRRIEFDFTFPNISAIGKFAVYGSLDLLNYFGITSNIRANCDFNFGFENLRLNGSFHYKPPVLFGSVSIDDLALSLELDGMNSELTGAINSYPITAQMNNLLVKQVLAQFNQAKSFINWLAEHLLETQINRLLVGKHIWDIL